MVKKVLRLIRQDPTYILVLILKNYTHLLQKQVIKELIIYYNFSKNYFLPIFKIRIK